MSWKLYCDNFQNLQEKFVIDSIFFLVFLGQLPNITILCADIYRQKLQQLVIKGELSDEDVKALERIQILLCIPKETVEAAHADICGSLFEKVNVVP